MAQKKVTKKKKPNQKNKKISIRKRANKKINKSKNIFSLAILHRSIKQITSRKDLEIRVNKGAAFAFSYFFENLAKDVLKLGFKQLDDDKKNTLMPIHIFQGLQKNLLIKDNLFKLVKDDKLKNQIEKLNTKINSQEPIATTSTNDESMEEDIVEVPVNKNKSRSKARSKSKSKVRSKSRSKARSQARSQARSKVRSKSRSKNRSKTRNSSRLRKVSVSKRKPTPIL